MTTPCAKTMSKKLKRFDQDPFDFPVGMVEESTGTWVRYEDAMELIKSAETLLSSAIEQIQDFDDGRNDNLCESIEKWLETE